ncbi:MAG: helix-turn-helix domain-containing protein [Thiobacillus sp.]
MSIRVMSLVWESYPGGGSDLLALLALADWSDDNGKCYPSMASISKKIRLKPRQAQRVVHQLIEAGFVSVVGNEFGGKPGATRQYRINLHSLTGVAHDTGVAEDVDGCHGRRETGVAHDTQTVIEPSITVSTREQARAPSSDDGKKRGTITLKTFLNNCMESGEQAIHADDPIFEYAKTVGIDEEMLAVAWAEFKTYWLSSGKRRKDWRETYRNAIRQNRARLWFIREGEQAQWSTIGEQARRAAA